MPTRPPPMPTPSSPAPARRRWPPTYLTEGPAITVPFDALAQYLADSKARCDAAGIRQTDLARATGVSVQQRSRWFRGGMDPKPRQAIRFEQGFAQCLEDATRTARRPDVAAGRVAPRGGLLAIAPRPDRMGPCRRLFAPPPAPDAC